MTRWVEARALRTCLHGFALICTVSSASISCLDRPLSESTPLVSARVVDIAKQSAITKIDLLFVIDNSSSMGDKQAFLAEAVPDLLKGLAEPGCIDPNAATADPVDADPVTHKCPPNTERKFEPIQDIHVGIVTSSLGGYGARTDTGPVCPQNPNPNATASQDDRAHLVARSGDKAIPTFQNKGFLSWTPTETASAGAAHALEDTFKTMVVGVGEQGCGYESTLEAAYRFLNAPAPYDTLTAVDDRVVTQGVDKALLQQRREFLRTDSLVAVITITDENDYSAIDYGSGALAFKPHGLLRGTSACDKNPNDRCCINCRASTTPDNCVAPKDDPACQLDGGKIPTEQDSANLRLTRSKQQYGIDLRQPVERYIEGFTAPVLARYGQGAPNPLFRQCDGDKCLPDRDPSLVFWAAIVGVPWQDIARNPRDLREGYQNSDELTHAGTWDLILGDPQASPPLPPNDLHMVVSPEPRPGLALPSSRPDADPVHGHEWLTQNNNLQYACTFALAKEAQKTCLSTDSECECYQSELRRNPLCQDPVTGAYGLTQVRAKAFPAVRELQVLKGLGPQGIVASICPASTDSSRSDYGYRPAIHAIADRLATRLAGRCLPRALDISADQTVPCLVMEAFTPSATEQCDCETAPGRAPADPQALTAEVRALGSCVCAIHQLSGESRTQCQHEKHPTAAEGGWCYVDPMQSKDRAQCALVRDCAASERRIIRYSGLAPRGRTVIICQENTVAGGGEDICAPP